MLKALEWRPPGCSSPAFGARCHVEPLHSQLAYLSQLALPGVLAPRIMVPTEHARPCRRLAALY
eukprot:501982-Prymnesium_polylepis.3